MGRITLMILIALVLAVFAVGCGCGGNDDDVGSTTDDDTDDDSAADDDDTDLDDDTTASDDDADDDSGGIPPDPAEPGTFAIADASMTYPDPISGKDQNLRVFFPSSDGSTINATDGPRPIIIFGPGFSAPMGIYFSYGRHLASYGYVVVHRDNTVLSHVGLANTTSAIIDWLANQAELPDSLFFGKLDFNRIGASGHSMGGKISLLTAYYDDRIKASATIDPVDVSPLPTSDYPSVTPELMPDIHIPTLFVGSEFGGACAPVDNNYHQYWLYANSPSIEIMIKKSGHITFTDLPDAIIDAGKIICPTGDGDYDQIKYLTRRYVTAFYEIIFNGNNEYEYYLTGEGINQDVTADLVTTESK